MRRVVLVAAMIVLAQSGHAADMPDLPFLRGALSDAPAPRSVWQGYYAGGQAGYGTSDMNFTGATKDIAARLLAVTALESEGNVSTWPLLGKTSQHGKGYGGFVGYNAQWDDVVLGVEANYFHGSFGGSDSDSMSRVFSTSNGYTNSVNYQADASIAISDMGSVRGRAGYAWNGFLPYLFGGISMGQADITRTATVYGVQNNVNAAPGYTSIPFSLSATSAQHGHFLYGYAGGLGVDVMLFQGLFLRGEWEYLKFAAPINTSVSTVRAGVGYKF